MSDDTADLTERWRTSRGAERVNEVRSWLHHSGSGVPEPFGRVAGRVDLRGIPLSAPVIAPDRGKLWPPGSARDPGSYLTIETLEVRDQALVSLDLSGALLSHARFLDCSLEACLFDAAVCVDWRLWRSDVRRCSFVGADLSSSSFGAWSEGQGNIFEEVDFTRADLRGLGTSAATYIGTDFSFAQLDGINFFQSSIVRCTFRGPLRRVIFDGRALDTCKPDPNPMEDVDMSQAEFDDVEFRHVRLAGVRLPQDPDLIRITSRQDLDLAAASIAERNDTAARVVRVDLNRLRASLEVGEDALLNLRDLRKISDETEALARQLLVGGP